MKDRDIIILVAAVIFAVIFTGFPMMGWGYYGMAGMMSGLGFGLLAFFFMVLFWILIIVALVLFIIWLIKQISDDKSVKKNERRAR